MQHEKKTKENDQGNVQSLDLCKLDVQGDAGKKEVE